MVISPIHLTPLLANLDGMAFNTVTCKFGRNDTEGKEV
jgi:hypothetical protein